MEEREVNISFQPELIGRNEEFDRLCELWEEALENIGSTVLISGEAGIGKTRLVTELTELAQKNEAIIIKGWCLVDSLEPLLPFKEGLRDAELSQLISDDPPPKIVSAYLINKDGMLLTKAERSETELDSDIFASMLTAVGNFVTDSLSMMGEKRLGELNTIGYGEHSIMIQTIKELSLATVIKGNTNSEFLIDDMRKTLLEIGDRYELWDGNIASTDEVRSKIEWFIDSDKYNGKHLVDDPKVRRENLFDNVLLGLRRISSRHPIVLFLDDLQWAEPTTLKLLHYLSRNTRDKRILILGTYRPEDVIELDDGKAHLLKTAMQDMSREDLFIRIALERLNEPAVEEFVRNNLGDAEFEEEFLERIYKESEGNPFFLLEVIHMLVEEGHLVKEDGEWKVGKNLESVNIPSRVYDVVVRRVDRLMAEHRELLECASVMGLEFDSEVVGQVMGVNRIRLLKSLNKIERDHNLIHSIKKRYMFDHSKIRDVLYNGIIEELKEEYHKIIAETYENIHQGREEIVYELAKHWYLGGVSEKSFEYYRRAAEMAKGSYANKQAIECYDRILEIIPFLETMEDRDDIMIDSLHQKGECLKTIGEWGDAEDAFNEALQIAEKSGDRCKIAECTVKMGDIHLLESRYDESLELFRGAMEIYRELGDERGYCESLGRMGSVYNSISEYDRAMEYLNEMQEIAERLQDSNLLSKLYGSLGSTHSGKGELKKSMEYFEKKLNIKEEEDDLMGIGYTMVNMATIYVRLQNYDKCMDLCNRVLEIVEKTGDKLMEQNVLGKLGIAYAEQGNFSKGLEYYEKKLALSQKIGDRRSVAYVANNVGELYKDMGEYEKALEYYQKDVDISKELGDKRGYAITIGNMGNLYKLTGDFDRAEELYEETIQIARDQETKDVLSYFLTCKADLCFEKNQIEKAVELNQEALEITEDIKMHLALFNANILRAKIISKTDKDRGIQILKDMLKEDHIGPEEATLHYELYNISGEDEHKKEALEFYKRIYDKNPSRSYRDIIDKLKS